VSTSYQHLVKDIEEGGTILIDDGLLQLMAVERHLGKNENEHDYVVCKVVVGGMLGQHKGTLDSRILTKFIGINLPGTKISQPALTQKDIKDLEFGLANGVDYISMSFVRQKQDILDGREWIKKFGYDYVPIIAKIERAEYVLMYLSLTLA
jgi:pyruvate kinase